VAEEEEEEEEEKVSGGQVDAQPTCPLQHVDSGV